MAKTLVYSIASGVALLAAVNAYAQDGYDASTGIQGVCVSNCNVTSGSVGGGYTANQQAMLGVASQLGSALGAMLRNSFADGQRRAQAEAERRRLEAEQARQRALAEEAEQQRRNQALLGNMRGTIGAVELAPKTGASGQLTLRTTKDMFDGSVIQANALGPGSWAAYYNALQRRDAAAVLLGAANSDLEAAQRLLADAERNAAEHPGPEAMRTLEEARALRDKVQHVRDEAAANLAKAEATLADAGKARSQALSANAAAAAPTAAPAPPPQPIDYDDADAILGSMTSYLHSAAWKPEEAKRVEEAFNKLPLPDKEEPPNSVTSRMRAWDPLEGRATDADLIAAAESAEGPGLYSSGWQSGRYADCAVFALATAAGLPYGVVAARADELIREAPWRPPELRANPQQAFKEGGLMGGEMIMLAEAFGQADVIPQSRFADTIKSGRPVMVNLTNPNGRSSHQVVLSKTFQRNGVTWYEMINSGQDGPSQRTFIRADEISKLIAEQGVAFRPDPGTTVKLLK